MFTVFFYEFIKKKYILKNICQIKYQSLSTYTIKTYNLIIFYIYSYLTTLSTCLTAILFGYRVFFINF